MSFHKMAVKGVSWIFGNPRATKIVNGSLVLFFAFMMYFGNYQSLLFMMTMNIIYDCIKCHSIRIFTFCKACKIAHIAPFKFYLILWLATKFNHDEDMIIVRAKKNTITWKFLLSYIFFNMLADMFFIKSFVIPPSSSLLESPKISNVEVAPVTSPPRVVTRSIPRISVDDVETDNWGPAYWDGNVPVYNETLRPFPKRC
jgi:hypothetical protein